MKNPTVANEKDRLKALESYAIMDTLSENEYDSITKLAAYICNTPISLVSLLDDDRQWFKSSVGIDATETPKEISFCQYAIQGEEVYEVQNAQLDNIFVDNPLVTGSPDIRFYAGAPLTNKEGYNLGTLCVIDTIPRMLTDLQKNALKLLANQVINLMELRRKNIELKNTQKEFQNFIELSKDLVCIANVDGCFHKVNPAFTTVLGYPKEELEGVPFINFVHPEDLDKTYVEVEKLSQGEKTISFENRYRCKNGDYVSLSWNSSPDPETGNLYCIARDITLEKEKQAQLIATTANLSALLDAAQFSIIATGVDGIVTNFNKGAEKLLGYTATEIIGNKSPASFHVEAEVIKYTKELSLELGVVVAPTFADYVVKSCAAGLSTAKEWTYNRKDGSSFPMLLSITAVKNNDGENIGFLGIGKDITKEKEAELKLLNSYELLDEAQVINKRGSWKFNSITKQLLLSKGHYAIFELDGVPDDQLYTAYRARIHPDDLDILDKLDINTLKSGEDYVVKYRIVFPDNRLKYISEKGRPFKNENGERVGVQGSIQDITEKREAELSLKVSNELLDNSQRIAKIGSWKFDLVSNDLIWSKEHYAIFEIEETVVEGLNEAFRSRIHPDDIERLDEQGELTIKTGADFNISYRIVFPDGRLKHISEIGHPFKNSNGEVVSLQGTIQDVTERTIVEQKVLEKSKEVNDIRAALDEAAIVSVTDLNGVFSYVNDNFCSASKYTKEELLGVSQRILSDHLDPEFAKNILRTIIKGDIWKGEIENRAKDGSVYWEKTTIVPFKDLKGKIYQYIAISADISEQKLAQENLNFALIDLEKNIKELDQFAYVVSHDLKAPLRAINNLAEWIIEDMPEMPDDVKANLELLKGRILRMENLINGILDYSRIGRTHIEKEKFDSKLMIDQIVETIVPTANFEVIVDKHFPEVYNAKILLYQIFSNIISNAVKYNDKDHGKIECYYEDLQDFHQFTIKDNGPGIPLEYQEKVFGVFQTIEARDKKESTGIGLSIVKKIIDEQEGIIYIDSKDEQGTSFIFTLPK